MIEVDQQEWRPSELNWVASIENIHSSFLRGSSIVIEYHPPTKTHEVSSGPQHRDLANGWIRLVRKNLDQWTDRSDSKNALSFFDGRPPRWSDAVSNYIPQRKIVHTITEDIVNAMRSTDNGLFFITGPGGEGKSTALRQTCCFLLRRISNLQIFFRNDDEQNQLPTIEAINSIPSGSLVIFAADEASNIIPSLDIVRSIRSSRSQNIKIHFLIAARDTDWHANRGRERPWSAPGEYREYKLQGLTLDDAKMIVGAWSQHGSSGLQELYGIDPAEASERLYNASVREEQEGEGAFLGAMLTVRYGSELKKHIANVLHKLSKLAATTNRTLLDAFAVIVAFDRIKTPILRKEVLSDYLGCRTSELRKNVIIPLGDEAMVTVGDGRFLTRHRAIANATYELLETEFTTDFGDIYVNCVRSALALDARSTYVPDFNIWRYLASQLLPHDKSIALKVAQCVHSSDPNSSYYIVHLSKIYRECDRPGDCQKLFRQAAICRDGNRGFYTEWAAAERHQSSFYLGIWLSYIGLTDGASSTAVNNDDAKMLLREVCSSALGVARNFNDQDFQRLAEYTQQLALMLPLTQREQQDFKDLVPPRPGQGKPKAINQMIDFISVKANDARSQCSLSADTMPSAPGRLELTSFEQLIHGSPFSRKDSC